MGFQLAAYLDRVGLTQTPAGAAGLKALQAGQLRAIAFENLDPMLGKTPDLSPDAVWDKLVVQGRGGYCFELNGLLGGALVSLGYPARRVMARVRRGAAIGARSHLAWIVEAEGREWLVDCGFGGPAPVFPLLLETGPEQEAAGIRFRLVPHAANGETVLERLGPQGWFALYGFDRAHVTDADVEAANFVTARWENSPFPANLMLNHVLEDGRISVFNRTARTESNGEVVERTIASAAELHDLLTRNFGLPVTEAAATKVWQRIATRADPARA